MTARKPFWEPWMDQAACFGVDPELFHPERGDTSTETQARQVCATCPVTADCLDYALRPPVERFGIWGGASERQRRQLRRQQRREAHGQEDAA